MRHPFVVQVRTVQDRRRCVRLRGGGGDEIVELSSDGNEENGSQDADATDDTFLGEECITRGPGQGGEGKDAHAHPCCAVVCAHL